MSSITEIGGDKQTIEGSLNVIHNRLKCYTNDQITILDDLMLTIESFYKTEKHTNERMRGSLQKSLEHAQSLSYLGSSIIGSTWTIAIKELIEHYSQREASYPVLKHVILESFKKVKTEKIDEHNKALLYDEEMIKEMVDIERRTIKTRRTYDDACERLRQHYNLMKEKESGIKRLHHIILPKTELDRLETLVVDTRNIYILHVYQMNYALKFYIEQFIVDLDKLLVCDLFPQIKQILDDLVYSEYKRLHDILQRAIDIAIEDGDEQKRRLLPKTFQNYPLIILPDQNDKINTDDKYLAQLSLTYVSAINEVRENDQQIQLVLETSVLNAQQNKDSRIDAAKIKLKRMEMRKAIALFIIDTLETLVPNIKTAPTSARNTSKLMGGLKPFITAGSKMENTSISTTNPETRVRCSSSFSDYDASYASVILTPSYPCQAIVLYDFEGVNENEMSVRKDDKIFIESKPEYDGWLIAKRRDRTGLVPESYVQLITPTMISSEQGIIKNVGIENTKSKPLQTNTKQTINTTGISSSASAVDDEDDYFSDE